VWRDGNKKSCTCLLLAVPRFTAPSKNSSEMAAARCDFFTSYQKCSSGMKRKTFMEVTTTMTTMMMMATLMEAQETEKNRAGR